MTTAAATAMYTVKAFLPSGGRLLGDAPSPVQCNSFAEAHRRADGIAGMMSEGYVEIRGRDASLLDTTMANGWDA